MRVRRLPWITLALTSVLLLNPVGLGFVCDAFFASEQLTRNIALPIVLMAAAVTTAVLIIEIAIRRWILR